MVGTAVKPLQAYNKIDLKTSPKRGKNSKPLGWRGRGGGVNPLLPPYTNTLTHIHIYTHKHTNTHANTYAQVNRDTQTHIAGLSYFWNTSYDLSESLFHCNVKITRYMIYVIEKRLLE